MSDLLVRVVTIDEVRPHPKRRIFKIISPDYLTRKGGTEHH